VPQGVPPIAARHGPDRDGRGRPRRLARVQPRAGGWRAQATAQRSGYRQRVHAHACARTHTCQRARTSRPQSDATRHSRTASRGRALSGFRFGLGLCICLFVCAFVCLLCAIVCSPQIGALDLDLLVYLDLISTKARTSPAPSTRRRRTVDAGSTGVSVRRGARRRICAHRACCACGMVCARGRMKRRIFLVMVGIALWRCCSLLAIVADWIVWAQGRMYRLAMSRLARVQASTRCLALPSM
jgi:hypothetical protein